MDKWLHNLSIVENYENLTTTIDPTEPYELNGSGFNDSDYYCSNFEGNITYLNISCETQLSYSLPLYGYITPFLIIITIIANSLIVIVLSRRAMTTPTNIVLLGNIPFSIVIVVVFICNMLIFQIILSIFFFLLIIINNTIIAMALCDVFTILFPGPGIIYMFTFGQHSKPLGPEIMCYLYTFFNETFPSMVSFVVVVLVLVLRAMF